jgi:hypothetical protein
VKAIKRLPPPLSRAVPVPSVLSPSAAAISGVTASSAPVSNISGKGPRPLMLTSTITSPASTETGTTDSDPEIMRESANPSALAAFASTVGSNTLAT